MGVARRLFLDSVREKIKFWVLDNSGMAGSVDSQGYKFCPPRVASGFADEEATDESSSLASPQKQISPSLHCSTNRSYNDDNEDDVDEDNEGSSEKGFCSPLSLFSQDVSDVDSNSFSTGNDFCSFKCLTPSPLDSPNSPYEPVDNFRSTVNGVDKLIREDQKPINIESNDLLWLPPPPHDEDDDVKNGCLEYDDDDVDGSDDVRDNGDNGFSMKEGLIDAQSDLLKSSVYGHFRALVSQLLKGEDILSEGWLDVVSSLSWQAANFVKPDTHQGASMDPADYVKVKCIPSGRPGESVLVRGVVCSKNVKHKRMISQHKDPRLLLLAGSLEYQKVSNKLASLETILQQEIDHLKKAISKIEALRPNVLLVEKSVSSYAQEYLLEKEISLVLNVKKPLLERIARCTGARILTSIDAIASTKLGHCKVFRVERMSEEGLVEIQPAKKFSRTLMFFEGCPSRRGCTVLLRGPNRVELKRVKNILLYASFAAYHLSLETSFLADSGAAPPKLPQNLRLNSPTALNSPDLSFSVSKDCQFLDNDGIELSWDDGVSERQQALEEGEVNSMPESQQSILVSLSSSCISKGTICERSKLLRIKFYGSFDKPLGRYLRDDLFNKNSLCQCCREPPEAHVRSFTHQHGSLIISVKKLLSAKLSGECDGRIWMWHRCIRCDHEDGVPPATRRVVMSDAAWGLSFGKFLELSFSNQAVANRVASCGHSLQKDCLRFFGFGNMVAFFHYSPVNILSVRLPPFVLEFTSQSRQEWLIREMEQISLKAGILYGEVIKLLNDIEQKIVTYSDETLKARMGNLLKKLKDLAKNERQKYNVFLQSENLENPLLGHASSYLPELNRLKRSLFIDSYIWDRRINLLDSKVNCSSEIEAHILEFSIHNDFVRRSESFPVNRRVGFSPPKFNTWESDPLDLANDEDDKSLSSRGSSSSPGSSFSDKIDFAWANGSPLAEVNRQKKSSLSPVRAYSFDSSSFQMDFSHHSPGGFENLSFLFGRMPLHLSSASKMVRDGARLLLPQCGVHNLVVAVYDKEPSSIIAYALNSKEHLDFVSCSPEQVEKDPIKNLWSLSIDDIQKSYYGSTEAFFPQGNVYLDTKQLHFKFNFMDESSIPGEKANFSVTCYFAKEFYELRRKCCQSELDVISSLGRCHQWEAQGGKSNVYFAKSMDQRFIFKQVTKTELESFEDFAPQYFKYLAESIASRSPTCLAKILGVYQVTIKNLKGGKEVKMDLMVMENLFFGRNISKVYDLKGSSRSRYNADFMGRNKVMLDSNLVEALRTEPIFLGSKAKRSLERAIWNDTSFLAMVHVMDYSLLVGIDEEKKELVLGIIDFIRQYTWDKHLETWVKASGILGGSMNASPTIISPKQYKKRFRKAMSTYFLTVPDQWLP